MILLVVSVRLSQLTNTNFQYFQEWNPEAKVYAHSTFQKEFDSLMNVRMPITYVRSAHQIGNALPDQHQENSGIGHRLR